VFIVTLRWRGLIGRLLLATVLASAPVASGTSPYLCLDHCMQWRRTAFLIASCRHPPARHASCPATSQPTLKISVQANTRAFLAEARQKGLSSVGIALCGQGHRRLRRQVVGAGQLLAELEAETDAAVGRLLGDG
jgi:hypothetical protein